jgi:hypothetical protein
MKLRRIPRFRALPPIDRADPLTGRRNNRPIAYRFLNLARQTAEAQQQQRYAKY